MNYKVEIPWTTNQFCFRSKVVRNVTHLYHLHVGVASIPKGLHR